MKDKIFVVISQNGIQKMVKTVPALKPGELYIEIFININDSYFKRPTFKAQIILPENQEKEVDLNKVKANIENVVNFAAPEIKLIWEGKEK